MKDNKNIIIGLLVFIIVILMIFIGLLVSGTIQFSSFNSNENIIENNDEENLYTYNELKGLYKFTSDSLKDKSTGTELDYTVNYELYLYENGTFSYHLSTIFVPIGYLGNYIIEGNTIKLNYIFKTGSGVDAFVINGGHTLTINSNISLIESEKLIEDDNFNLTSVVLEKASLEEEQKFLQNYDFSKRIKESYISNEVTNKIR